MADTKMSEKLWRDCKSDQERADFILCGRAHETGVIATSIQSEVAMAFQRLATLQATQPADVQTLAARVQYLVDNWPEKLEDGGITFPDGYKWDKTT